MNRKLIVSVAVACVAAAGTAQAQTLPMARIGEVTDADGAREYSVPSTTVVVDVTVRRESVKTGPYARFAQRYFGVIAPLSDKDNYEVISAEIGYYDAQNRPSTDVADIPADVTIPVNHTDVADGFPRVLPDRSSADNLGLEESAAAAAKMIFDLRQRRLELVTGDFAETVYGEGLKHALDRIDRVENEYLELFFGKQTVTTAVRRFYVVPEAEQATAVVCRFNGSRGLLSPSDLTGEPILLELHPQGIADRVFPAEERRKRTSAVKGAGAEFAVADMVNCRILDGKRELGARVIPIYQLGVIETRSL